MENIRLLTAWLISSGLLAVLNAAVGPKFTYSPEPIVAPFGDEVEFECSLDVPAEQIWWKHNRRKLSVVHYNATKSQLLLQVEHESQVGDYQCVAWYGASALASTPARLTLARLGPPTAEFNRKLIVTAGNNVLINCTVPVSNPPAGVQYYKNNRTFTGGKILSSDALLLTNVTPADTGQYSCSVINTYVVGNPWFMPGIYNLNVAAGNRQHRPPQFAFLPSSQYLTQIGLNVTLECVGFGEPVPRTMWKRAMGSLANDRMQTTIAGLQISDVRATDEGTYICEIGNGVSPMLTHRISLVVQEAPIVLRGPEDRRANEGGRTNFECFIRGKPAPSIHWLLNGDLVTNDSHVLVTGGKLELTRIEKRHAGWYQCMAENELGATFAAAQLLVIPRQVTFNTTDHALDAPLNHNPQQHRKKHHKKKKEMTPPSKPVVSQLSDSSVMVRWHHPLTGLPICFFKVQYRQLKRGKEWMTNNEDIPAHIYSYEVTNLEPGSDYKFRIAAVYSNNDNMQGATSVKFHLRAEIDPREMPSTPKITHLAANGATSIKIFWDYDGKEPRAEGFYVYYRSTSSAGDYMKSTVGSVDLRNHVITNLEPDTAYDFKIQSFRTEAPSDFSEILTQKTERLSTLSPSVTMSTPATVEIDAGGKSGQQYYVTLAAVLGGLALILVLCTSIFCCNKHRQHQSTSSEDDDVDKSRHIQLEAIHVNGHAGNHLSNHTGTAVREGNVLVSNGCCSKMNITSNPLDPEENKTKNVMEIAFITTNTCDDSCSSSVLTARLASAAVLPSCAMESESWRRPDIPRAVDNYV